MDMDKVDYEGWNVGEKTKKIREIETHGDCSIASSITMQSNNSESTTTSDMKLEFSINSQETKSTKKSPIQVNGKKFTLESIGVT